MLVYCSQLEAWVEWSRHLCAEGAHWSEDDKAPQPESRG